MTTAHMTIHSTEFDGHIATLRYQLAPDHGWDVSAELDSAVVRVRHCNDWSAVERMEAWLLTKLCESPVMA